MDRVGKITSIILMKKEQVSVVPILADEQIKFQSKIEHTKKLGILVCELKNEFVHWGNKYRICQLNIIYSLQKYKEIMLFTDKY